jgi:hypothetical protein
MMNLVANTLRQLQNTRWSELFVLERLRRERQTLQRLEKESMARLDSLRNKIWWEARQKAPEKKS